MVIKKLTCISSAGSQPQSFLQSNFWGEFKAAFGWKALPFTVEWFCAETTEVKPLLVLYRRLMPGMSLAYIPWGPELPEHFPPHLQNDALKELALALKPFLPPSTVFIRFDPPWFNEGADSPPPLIGKPFFRAGADVQPPDTVIINLEVEPDVILAQMKNKWRYNIRLAEKKVMVKQLDAAGIDLFYSLLHETALRDGIALHSIGYYKKLFELAEKYAAGDSGIRHDLRLYLAEYENQTIAAIITLFYGKTATYLYGASSNNYRNLMAPYALQWRAILDAKKHGCTQYDFFGIPPDKSPNHPMAGLYRFKTGFGGKIIHRAGSWDFPCKIFAYAAFRFAEKLRKAVRSVKKRCRHLPGQDKQQG